MGTIILILAAIFVVIVVPLFALTKAAQASRDAEQLAERTRVLEWELQTLRGRVESELSALTSREQPPREAAAEPVTTTVAPTLDQLRTARDAARTSTTTPPPATTFPATPARHVTAVPPPIPPILPHAEQPRLEPVAAFHREPPATPPATPVAARPKASVIESINWEQFLGVKGLAWVGGFAFFLGAVFGLKYSFEQGLIPPWLRAAMGFVTGIGLLIGGAKLSQKRYKITADTLSATGVVILYAVTFACRAIYKFEFFNPVTTFLLMTLITGTAFFIAVRLNAQVVAVLGMLGGFLTPLLLSTGQDNPFGLFSYIALLDLGLLAVAYSRRWDWLNLAGAIGTVLMQFGWVVNFYSDTKVFVALAIFFSFCALYLGASIWSQRRGRTNVWLIAATLLPPAAMFFFVLQLIVGMETRFRPGLIFSFLLVADLTVLALATLHAKAVQAQKPAAERNASDESASVTIPNLRWLSSAAGGVVFTLLALWTGLRVNDALLFWALGGYLAFAVLHTAFPILLNRQFPGEPVPAWTQLFPVLGLLLTLIPIIKLDDISFLLWPFVLLLDLVAIATAVALASVAGIVIALLVTVGVALWWLIHGPAEVGNLSEMLIVIVGLAALFTGAASFAGKRILARQKTQGNAHDAPLLPAGWTPADLQQQIPALSGITPFLLLLIVTAKMPLANPSPVFGVALALVGLLLGLARFANMTWLPAIGLGCTFLLEHAWHFRHVAGASPGLALGWYLVFYAVFAIYPFLFHRGDGAKTIAWTVSALSGPLHFWLVYDLVNRAWPNEFMGLIPALFAVPAGIALLVAWEQIPVADPKRNTVLAWFGGIALFFVTLIFPIQFERQWLTIAWGLEGAALLWLFHRVPHHGLRYTGVGLLILAFTRLALNPAVFAYHPRSETPLLNWYLYTYGLVIAALFVGAKLLAPPNHRLFEKDGRPLLVALGTILAFLLLNIEIANFFTPAGQTTLTFNFRGNFARDMSYTIGWALFAFVMLVIGIVRRVPAARWAGIGLLAVTLLKLFFHDLATLNQLYRVGALVGVAVVAIVASFLYQKFLVGARAENGVGAEPEK